MLTPISNRDVRSFPNAALTAAAAASCIALAITHSPCNVCWDAEHSAISLSWSTKIGSKVRSSHLTPTQRLQHKTLP